MFILRKFLDFAAKLKFTRFNTLQVGQETSIKCRSIRSAGKSNKLKVGSKSLIDCNIVFEKDNGTIQIGDNTFIGGATLVCVKEINIGNNVQVAWGCTLLDHNSHCLDYLVRRKDLSDTFNGRKDWNVVTSKSINICDDVWVGFNSIILKGVTIGEGAVVAAGSVVVKDVPPFVVVAGNPAIVVKHL